MKITIHMNLSLLMRWFPKSWGYPKSSKPWTGLDDHDLVLKEPWWLGVSPWLWKRPYPYFIGIPLYHHDPPKNGQQKISELIIKQDFRRKFCSSNWWSVEAVSLSLSLLFDLLAIRSPWDRSMLTWIFLNGLTEIDVGKTWKNREKRMVSDLNGLV